MSQLWYVVFRISIMSTLLIYIEITSRGLSGISAVAHQLRTTNLIDLRCQLVFQCFIRLVSAVSYSYKRASYIELVCLFKTTSLFRCAQSVWYV